MVGTKNVVEYGLNVCQALSQAKIKKSKPKEHLGGICHNVGGIMTIVAQFIECRSSHLWLDLMKLNISPWCHRKGICHGRNVESIILDPSEGRRQKRLSKTSGNAIELLSYLQSRMRESAKEMHVHAKSLHLSFIGVARNNVLLRVCSSTSQQNKRWIQRQGGSEVWSAIFSIPALKSPRALSQIEFIRPVP
jgi:hypothetical protein